MTNTINLQNSLTTVDFIDVYRKICILNNDLKKKKILKFGTLWNCIGKKQTYKSNNLASQLFRF